jgi:hypothetical protein
MRIKDGKAIAPLGNQSVPCLSSFLQSKAIAGLD